MQQKQHAKSGGDHDHHEQNGEKVQPIQRPTTAAICVWFFVFFSVIFWVFLRKQISVQSEYIKISIESMFSVALVIVVVVQTYINFKQAKALDIQEGIFRDQANSAKQAASVAERSFRVSNRAYVFINEATLEHPINSGNHPYPQLVLQNSGKTPAYRYRVRFEQAFLAGADDEKARRGIMPPMRPLSDEGHVFGPSEFSTLRPDGKTWESEEQRQMAMGGTSTYHIWGLICYVDIFNKEHSYPFSLSN